MRSRYLGHFSPTEITHERHPYLAREGEVWVSFLSSKCNQSFLHSNLLHCVYIVPRCIETLQYPACLHTQRVTQKSRSWSWMVSSHPFCSMSIGPPIPEIRLFQNLTSKIQGQGHACCQKSRSHSWLSIQLT